MGELADKLAKGASELRFLLTQHKVADDIQGELYANGVDTVAKFAAAASDEADLKKMLKDSFSIDPTESLAPKPRESWSLGRPLSPEWSGRQKPKLRTKCGTSLSPSLARTISLCAKLSLLSSVS